MKMNLFVVADFVRVGAVGTDIEVGGIDRSWSGVSAGVEIFGGASLGEEGCGVELGTSLTSDDWETCDFVDRRAAYEVKLLTTIACVKKKLSLCCVGDGCCFLIWLLPNSCNARFAAIKVEV